MSKKLKVAIIVILIVVVGIFGFRTYSSYRNKQIIIREVSAVIEDIVNESRFCTMSVSSSYSFSPKAFETA